jgi:hypothetical protein
MSSEIKQHSPTFHSRRFEEISDKYPPEEVAPYLRMQRRWVRRVTQLTHMSPIQRLVLLFIGTFSTPSRPFCFASMSYICAHVGCERTTINRAVAEAVTLGFMTVDRRKRGGNVYRIKMPE